jgi:oligopeptide transport system substrate-binding protein
MMKEEAMFSKKLAVVVVLVMIAPIVLAACGPAPEPVVVKETSIVVETVVVEKEGEKVVEEVTKVVEVEKEVEVVVTATPEPEPTEPAKAELEGLWYPIGTEPPTLDIQLANDTTSHLIIKQCIEGLFQYRADGSFEPAAATGYTVSDDGLVYTINLREGTTWSDGVPVVGQHFVDGVIRLLDPATAAEYGWLIANEVKNAGAFNSGEIDDPSMVGIKALDDYTLEIQLEGPRSYFETILPFSVFEPVRLDIIEQYGDLWTEAGNYVCNGAYLLDSWEHEAEVVMVKNPDYWDADNVTIEKLTFPIIQESATAMALYENDELHTLGGSAGTGIPTEDLPRIMGDPVLSEQLKISPRPGVYYVGLNTQRPPTDNVLVRQALAAAIDRQTIIDNVIQMPWRRPMSCSTPPNILGHQEYGTCGWAFDLEKAKELLAEAGYPDGEGFPVLQFWFNRADFNEDVIEAVAAMWEGNLGISVELRTNEWAVYQDFLNACNDSKEDLAACEFNAYRMGWVMDYGDPQNQLQVLFDPRSPQQYTGWESARFEELIDQAGASFDIAEREAFYEEADKILCEEEAALIPIISYDNSALVKDGVTFEYPPFGGPAFKHWALP